MNGENSNTTGESPSRGLGPAAGSSIEKGGGASKGPLIGTVIVVLLLIAGGVFFLANRIQEAKEAKTDNTEETATSTALEPDTATLKLQEQGTTDDLSSIEKDATDTDLNNLDKELGTIDTELSQ
jgi:uncharacterized protein HemX